MAISFKYAEPNKDQKGLLAALDEFHYNQTKPIFVYSGPPGSGKTWIIRLFFELHNIRHDEFITCAYSGKASNVLARNGLPSRTIHSLIYNIERVPRLDENTGKMRMVPTFILKDKLDADYKYIVVDELSMVPDNIMADLLSFGIPIIGMGDINQLPPVFGHGSYIAQPDFVLTEIMRQAWDSPIIKMSQYVLHDKPLAYGNYGEDCNVLPSISIGRNLLAYDCILCNRNATRMLINDIFRHDILKFAKYGSLAIGDKLVCKKNCWDLSLDGLYLTNGTVGNVAYIDEEHTDGQSIRIGFKPDYIDDDRCFDDIAISREYLENNDVVKDTSYKQGILNFDYAYALTVHSAQGSQYNKILYVDDGFTGDMDIRKKLKYTAITRAINSIDIVDSDCFYRYTSA